MNLAIIPARGGSKRIPRKNIKTFLGKPIIAYSIENAIKSALFDEIMVSTDDEEIAGIATQYGAVVPFMRSPENANDHAGTIDVLQEVIAKYQSINKEFDNICCIYPTAPFASAEKLKEAYNKLQHEDAVNILPVVRFGYPIQRAIKLANGRLQMFWPENFHKRSQDLEEAYHDAGLFYWFKKQFFHERISNIFDNAGYIVLQEHEVQDIDTMIDWKIAEIKYTALFADTITK